MAAIRILNISGNKKGWAPNLNIGLSHPIKLPNQSIPKTYMKLIAKVNFKKFLIKFWSYVNFPAKYTATMDQLSNP